jgi:uncharacterized membrane protein
VTPEERVEAVARPIRTAVAGIALAVGLFLLFRIPLVASFRTAVLALAALELLSFGAAVVSRGAGVRDAITIVIKLAILGGAYLALSQ